MCFPPETEPNLFFLSVVYALSYLQKNEKPKDFLTAIKTIGEEKFLKLKEIEKNIMLDYTQFVFFENCTILNEILAKEFGRFLRFYERRNKFRYRLRHKLKTKNEMKAELSSWIVQKFNGYQFLRTKLIRYESKNLLLLDIVYEPTQDITKPIFCFFAPEIN